ncbi:MAG: hypothetical protein ACLRWQ_17865 [Flavonifractor plautii]
MRYTTLAAGGGQGVPGMICLKRHGKSSCAIGPQRRRITSSVWNVVDGGRPLRHPHLCNAMAPVPPAPTRPSSGAALEQDVYVEAICDGRHLHPGGGAPAA